MQVPQRPDGLCGPHDLAYVEVRREQKHSRSQCTSDALSVQRSHQREGELLVKIGAVRKKLKQTSSQRFHLVQDVSTDRNSSRVDHL